MNQPTINTPGTPRSHAAMYFIVKSSRSSVSGLEKANAGPVYSFDPINTVRRYRLCGGIGERSRACRRRERERTHEDHERQSTPEESCFMEGGVS
jgi:hypothetical protein